MERGARLTTALVLGILVLAGLNLKVRLSTFTPRYDPADDTGYFRTESAYQFRYAKMIAQGQSLPDLDQAGQYPEGVRPARELTPLMMIAAGTAYRWIGGASRIPDFRWFVILWVAAVSSLAVLPLYFIGKRLCGSSAAALAAAAAYGLCWAAQSNMIGTFVFESFAQPLLFAALAFLCAALDEENREKALAQSAASGLFWAAALWSWHLSRFVWSTALVSSIWLAWTRRQDQPALERLKRALGPILILLAVAGVALPCLRQSAFLASPAMILGVGMWALLAFPTRRGPVLGATIAAIAVAAALSSEPKTFAHVYSFLIAKIRFGLSRPDDPARLSAEARSIWNGPSDSPSPGFAFFSLFPLALLVAPRLWLRSKGEKAPAASSGVLIDALTLLYAAGAVLALRLMQLFVFFLSLWGLRLSSARGRSVALAAGFALIAGMEGLKALAPASRFNPFIRMAAALPEDDRHPATTFADELAVIHWLRQNGAGKPVLSDISFSANFLAYAGVPILIHPKFEAPGIRAKTGEYLAALFGTEDAFAAYCRKYGAKLFVLTVYDLLDETPDGPRYTSGSMALRRDTAAVLMHFQPEKLKNFRLLYQNPDFRVFAVGEKPDAKPPKDSPPIYDLAQFQPRAAADGSLTLGVPGVLARIKESRKQMFLAGIFLRARLPDQALEAFEASMAAWPPTEGERRDYERLRKGLERSR